MSDHSKPLAYNIRWAARTFTDRPTTEALLAPEREAGNVSSNDYEAAAQFSAGSHRKFYPLIGAFLALPITLALRRPSWSPLRTYAFLAASTLIGNFGGQAMTVSAHFNFIRSLENPSGFAQALENIQKNSGSAVPPGLIIRAVGSGSKWAIDTDPIETSPTLSSIPDIQKPSINPPSKWDQIRAANARPSTNSSWDALRQSHERTRVPSMTSAPDSIAFQRSRDEDRAAEQAKFDEMLERERNIKDES
ncbi:hypothetical protein C0995_006667 [Termitomyces sp. Mi166|nr:hypothetical protein C0995_006667 [Termitomyces sp. Mi166\